MSSLPILSLAETRVLGVLAVFMRSEQAQYGGALSLLKSAVLESTLAILQAPVRMLAH